MPWTPRKLKFLADHNMTAWSTFEPWSYENLARFYNSNTYRPRIDGVLYDVAKEQPGDADWRDFDEIGSCDENPSIVLYEGLASIMQSLNDDTEGYLVSQGQQPHLSERNIADAAWALFPDPTSFEERWDYAQRRAIEWHTRGFNQLDLTLLESLV